MYAMNDRVKLTDATATLGEALGLGFLAGTLFVGSLLGCCGLGEALSFALVASVVSLVLPYVSLARFT